MIWHWLNKMAPFAPLPLRLVIGTIMFAHGAQKLWGWFGGPGFSETAKGFDAMFAQIPGVVTAALAGGGEFFGGLLVLLGLFTRFGAFLIAATMAVAVFAVHWPYGLFASNNGFEYPLTLLAGAISLLFSGGQALSLDSMLKIEFRK